MGDRTTVTLTVLASQAEQTKTYFVDEIEESNYGSLTKFYFYEVNYGNLAFLHKLREAGIAYESAWDSGGDYGAGSEFCWFTKDGVGLTKEVYESSRNPELTLLLKFIDQPDKLKQIILEHAEKVATPSWDNQEEYGKLYQMLKLVTPV